MFGGIGGSEIVIIGLIFLVIFGPSKLPEMARDIGKFVGNARRSIDEFKDELSMEAASDDEKPKRNRPSKGKRPSVNGSSAKSAKESSSGEGSASPAREDGLSDL